MTEQLSWEHRLNLLWDLLTPEPGNLIKQRITGYQSPRRLEGEMVLGSSTQIQYLPMVTHTELISTTRQRTIANDLVKTKACSTHSPLWCDGLKCPKFPSVDLRLGSHYTYSWQFIKCDCLQVFFCRTRLWEFFFFFYTAAPVAYGSSRAKGWIRAEAAGPASQPHQCRIWAASVPYTTAHGNTGFLTHQVRPRIEPASLWILVGFLTCWATTGIPRRCEFYEYKRFNELKMFKKKLCLIFFIVLSPDLAQRYLVN